GLDASHLVEQLNAHVRTSHDRQDVGPGDAPSAAGTDANAQNAARAAYSPASHGAADETAAAALVSHPGGDLTEPTAETMLSSDEPAELAAIPADRRVVLDVREDLRSGNEPFRAIMAALRERPAS